DIGVDTDNVIWLGLATGLAQLDLGSRTITSYTPNPENPKSTLENSIRTVAIDHSGRVWAGSDHGIYRFDKTSHQFTYFGHDAADATSLPSNFSWQIYVDSNGWI